MVHTALLIGALSALAAAIPQQAEHISKAQLTRASKVFSRDNNVFELAGRSVSTDGSCGTASGLTCGEGNCCSSLGWCGATPLHCGTGCQAGFGKCGTEDSSANNAAPVEAPAPVVAAAVQVPEPVSIPVPESKPAPHDAPAAPAAALQQSPPAVSSPPPAAPPASSTPSQPSGSKSGGLGDSYKQYSGDGSTGAGWPAQDSWVDFESAFAANKALMKSSCAQFGLADKETTDDEAQQIHDSILATSSATGVDSRYVLAVVMQESKGCVRAPTTNWGVRNPGLMQSFNGQGTCNEGGNVQFPCPSSTIAQMIKDGTAGTGPDSNSLSSALARAGGDDVSKYYKAARIYNSGSIGASGQLQDGIATHCYSTDIANRLTGWVTAASSCTYDKH